LDYDYFFSSSTPIVLTAPDAPTIGAAVAGDQYAIVNFATSTSDGGSPILYYTAAAVEDPSKTATSTYSPIIVTGLTNGTAYTFSVTATNAVGISASSSMSNSVTPSGGGGGGYEIPQNGLVGYWKFDEISGTTATDSSGHGNNGTINGATPVAGKVGGALSFDGNSNFVSVAHPLSFQIK